MADRPAPGRAATLGGVLDEATAWLDGQGIEDPGYDARLLVESLTGTTRRDWISDPARAIDAPTLDRIWAALRRRATGEPPHRILGAREFYGLELSLSADTLEPRPDTETLVDLVLPFVRDCAALGTCRILDLGTGTGAIALAILAEVREARATLTDISPDALATAQANAGAFGLADRVTPLESDWFEAVDGTFDLIVSNPPYIPTHEIEGLDREVRLFDPHRALDGGGDGMDAYRTIASGAAMHLARGGRIGLEIGAGQRGEVEAIFAEAGFDLVQVRLDLGGHERALLLAPRGPG